MIELPWVIVKSKPYFHLASKRPIYEAADHSQVSSSLGILQGLQPAYMDDDRAWDMGYQRRGFLTQQQLPEFQSSRGSRLPFRFSGLIKIPCTTPRPRNWNLKVTLLGTMGYELLQQFLIDVVGKLMFPCMSSLRQDSIHMIGGIVELSHVSTILYVSSNGFP